METTKTVDLIDQLMKARRRASEFEEVKKSCDAEVRELEQRISELIIGQGVTKVFVDLDGLEREVEVKTKIRYSVKGGKGDSEQRQTLLDRLEKAGFEDDIQVYRNINGNRLNGILGGLPEPMIDSLIGDGLLSIFTQPTVKIK